MLGERKESEGTPDSTEAEEDEFPF